MAATHVGEFPAQAPKNKHELTKSEKVGIALAVTAVASGILGVAEYKGQVDSTQKVLDKFTEPTPVAGQVVHDTQTPPEFMGRLKPSYKESAAYQLIDQYPLYDSELPEAREMMIDPGQHIVQSMLPEQVQLLSMPLATDLKTATSQEIENIASYHLFDASSQGNTTLTRGLQYVDFLVDPSDPHNKKVKDEIQQGRRGLIEVNKATSNHPRMQNFTFMYDKVSDGWVIEVQDTRTNEQIVSVYEDIVTPGGCEEVVKRDSYNPSNPQVQSELRRLFGNQ